MHTAITDCNSWQSIFPLYILLYGQVFVVIFLTLSYRVQLSHRSLTFMVTKAPLKLACSLGASAKDYKSNNLKMWIPRLQKELLSSSRWGNSCQLYTTIPEKQDYALQGRIVIIPKFLHVQYSVTWVKLSSVF